MNGNLMLKTGKIEVPGDRYVSSPFREGGGAMYLSPDTMSSDKFDSKVVDAINEFGNNPSIKYNLKPTDVDEGNCNSSSSTILKKAGVSNEVIEDIKDNMKGIHWGFSSTPKPWTKTEQENAVKEERQRRIEKNKRLDALIKSL